jgi:hypothetical protein
VLGSAVLCRAGKGIDWCAGCEDENDDGLWRARTAVEDGEYAR